MTLKILPDAGLSLWAWDGATEPLAFAGNGGPPYINNTPLIRDFGFGLDNDTNSWQFLEYSVVLPASTRYLLYGIHEDATNDTVGFADDTSLTITYASPVPVPAAAWLFGSALLGFLGLQRRKQRLAV